MATSALPAGFSITSINGQRCTAVPRSLTTLTGSVATEAAAQPPTTSTSTTAAVIATSAALGVNTVVLSSSAVVVVISTSTAPIQVTSFLATSSVASLTAAAASPASKGTTPTVSSSTQIPIAQSEITSSSARHISTIDTLSTLITSKTTSKTTATSATSTSGAAAAETSTAGGISSSISAGPVVGGVLGSMSFIALAAFIFWFIRRRRRNKRESLLTPLTTGIRSSFYAENPPRPDSRSDKFKAGLGYQTTRIRDAGSGLKESLVGLGAVLKSKVVRDRSDTPSVNLNRGNSQFMDGPIPQHSRNNSIQSSHSQHITFKEKASDWYERLAFAINPSKRRKLEDSADPFANARTMSEKKAKQTNPPDFSQLLSMGDKDLQLQAERRRNSLAANNNGSVPQLGSLGLDFDPFADPEPAPTTRPRKNTDTKMGLNPFLDPPPPTRPEPSIPKPSTYISDIRRSRGQSIDATTKSNNASSNQPFLSRPPSANTGGVGSRYPSTIAPCRDSHRDTVFTTFSENVRKGKGRSDPFDLERPELWRPRVESRDLYPMPLNPNLQQNQQSQQSAKAQGILGIDFNGQPGKRVDTDGDGGSSKYSSGIYSDFGEPGPDVAPGSLEGGSSYLGGIVAEGEGEGEGEKMGYRGNGMDIYAQQLREQGNGNVSPMSKASSKGGVGKAM